MRLAKERKSKYVSGALTHAHQMGHATNFELLESLRSEYPNLSATTVHRVTARLHERGELQLAPTGRENVLRYDANPLPHDHFMCSLCGWRGMQILDQLFVHKLNRQSVTVAQNRQVI